MIKIVRSTIPIGFAFGVVFSFLGYLGFIPFEPLWLWLLPFISAALCAVGGIIAAVVVAFLDDRFALHDATKLAIAFATAAVFNLLVVLSVMLYSGVLALNRQLLAAPALGLLMGAVYAAYSYYVENLKERMEFLKALADKNKQLQETSRRLAIIDERNRMSRELHDSVSQGLHGLVFSIHSLRNELELPTPRAFDILQHMEATASSTLDELRTMIEELKPSLLAEHGLEEALRTIVELFSQRNELPCDFEFTVPYPLPPAVETTIYRVTQEALANVERHSLAQRVKVGVNADAKSILLIIRDDGGGFDTKAASPGNGLHNMRQRVEEVGGTLKITSKLGLGTSLVAEFHMAS